VLAGTGTALNVVTVLVGSALGVGLRGRLPQRTRDVVTDGLGLMTLLVAALNAVSVRGAAAVAAVGGSAVVLIVLGSIVLGGITGSLLRLGERLESLGGWLQHRLAPAAGAPARARFVEGYVVSSLLFCVGPLTILGSLSDGLGRGIDQLALKSTLDGFAAIAFAASFGWGVAAAALTVAVVQGGLTVLGVALGGFLSAAEVDVITATGGLLLVGVALRLLRIREVPVVDLLPALAFAPALTALVAALR
jgi:uncharacterized protein